MFKQQMESPFPDILADEENGLRIENLIKGYSVTLALNHALSIWLIISRLRK